MPLMVQGLISGGDWWQLTLEFKMVAAIVCLNKSRHIELLLLKYPILFAYLYLFHRFLPKFAPKYTLFVLLG